MVFWFLYFASTVTRATILNVNRYNHKTGDYYRSGTTIWLVFKPRFFFLWRTLHGRWAGAQCNQQKRISAYPTKLMGENNFTFCLCFLINFCNAGFLAAPMWENQAGVGARVCRRPLRNVRPIFLRDWRSHMLNLKKLISYGK